MKHIPFLSSFLYSFRPSQKDDTEEGDLYRGKLSPQTPVVINRKESKHVKHTRIYE